MDSSTTTTAPPQVKPGYKTTEFWLTLGAYVLAILTTANVLAPESQWAKVAAILAAALAQMGYSTSRAQVKGAQLLAPGAARILLLMLGIAMLFVPGCTAATTLTPRQQAVQARELYNTTLAVLVEARRAGRIDDQTALQIEPFRAAADSALADMEQAALADDATRYSAAAKFFNSAVERLLDWRIRMQGQH